MIDDNPLQSELNVMDKVKKKSADLTKDFVAKVSTKNVTSGVYGFEHQQYLEESSSLIENMSKRGHCIIISYDLRIQRLHELSTAAGAVVQALSYIDCISYHEGMPKPSLDRIYSLAKPTDFENLRYYVLSLARKVESPSVIVLSPHKLLPFDDSTKIALNFQSLYHELSEAKIPFVFSYDTSADKNFKGLLERVIKKKA